ncbi:aldo/keto reductase [Haloparvum alkalitolerans]|uniref:aldo/keto reductase n=1 Tax=Haloparvum alkalitolerans TaxID=1042953 RepID=UPI003CF31C32
MTASEGGNGVPALGIGTYDLSAAECRAAVRHALEVGYRHVDTAEMYGNEAAVGDAIAAADVAREDVFVATKVHSRNLSYGDVIESARRSRERLGVETIDLLYVHWPINSYDPEETLPAFDDLVDRGLIDRVGLSNFTPALLREAVEVLDTPLFAHQVECHPLRPQRDLRRLAREEGHTLVAYSPLAKGAVTEVPAVADTAAEHGVTPAQAALAWLLSKESTAAIPRSTSPTHRRENYATRGVSLDADAIARIDDVDRRERVVDFPDAPWNRE